MTTITINECVFNVHQIYDLYASSKDGNVINIIKQVPHKGNKNNSGYMCCSIRKHGQSGQKKYQVHRFVWECFNGIIPDGLEIDHINNIRDDNRLCNLQLLTPRENCKKAVRDRGCAFKVGSAKCVKATNKNTNEKSYCSSMHAAQQHLGISRVSISNNCNGFHKSCFSKKDGNCYTFQCINKEDLPDNHKKSSNIKPRRVSDEDKRKHYLEWRNKKFECQNCGKMIKNNNKYAHKKRCDK